MGFFMNVIFVEGYNDGYWLVGCYFCAKKAKQKNAHCKIQYGAL